MRWRRVAGSIVVPAAVACCSTFGSSATDTTVGDGGDERSADAAPADPFDSGDEDADAGTPRPRTGIVCGVGSCAIGEVCCLVGTKARCSSTDCAAIDGGGKPVYTFACGRPSDCPDPDVCCFQHAANFCSNFDVSSTCRPRENCARCGSDGGIDDLGCDPTRSDECKVGTCSGAISLDSFGTSSWSKCAP